MSRVEQKRVKRAVGRYGAVGRFPRDGACLYVVPMNHDFLASKKPL